MLLLSVAIMCFYALVFVLLRVSPGVGPVVRTVADVLMAVGVVIVVVALLRRRRAR